MFDLCSKPKNFGGPIFGRTSWSNKLHHEMWSLVKQTIEIREYYINLEWPLSKARF